MSSNKTIIPGMEDAYIEPSPTFNLQQNGTRIPNSIGTSNNFVNTTNQKPIVGFLYSISKSIIGEYWPLHIGSNSIGRSSECDVCLNEASVSEQHAVIVVRQMKHPEKIIASICDARSTCGTMINGESLSFDQKECFNGDVITIGEHYDFYFILIDVKQIGLNVCRDFMPTQSNQTPFRNTSPSNNPYEAPIYNNKTQGFEQEQDSSNGGTIGMNDSLENKLDTKPGGTVFM